MPRPLVQSVIVLVLLLCPGVSTAGTEMVIDFIIANNPELVELKAINRNILNQLKVEAKGTGSFGQLTQEGTSTLDRAQTRYSVGITASIPLISPSEKAQRRIEEVQKERTLRLDVAELIKTYKAEQKAIEEESKILMTLYNELQWLGKRVNVGVDSQKDYNQKLNDYLTKRKDLELKKEQVSYLLDKVLSFVSEDKRQRLKGMLDGQDISKN
jgi:hypothetical protein